MTIMTIVDVVNLVYPGEQQADNVTFGQDGDAIFITKWAVPDVPEPTVEELEAMIPSLQNQFDLLFFTTIGQTQLMAYLDVVAAERQYSSAISCASYTSSTIPEWKAQADAFVAWRDAVFVYTLSQIALMQSTERTVPTFEEFKTELPEMVWPS